MVFHPFLTPANLGCLLFLVSLARGDFGWCFHADFWYHLKQKILIHAFFLFGLYNSFPGQIFLLLFCR